MFGLSTKVSFGFVVLVIMTWGLFSLAVLLNGRSSFDAQLNDASHVLSIFSGVRLKIRVDKQVYKPGESVLFSLRNDSRSIIWLATHTNGCQGSWWVLETYNGQGDLWRPVATDRSRCTTADYQPVQLPAHEVKTDEWNGFVGGDVLGNILVQAPTGTYRLAIPFVRTTDATMPSWDPNSVSTVTSDSFTMQ